MFGGSLQSSVRDNLRQCNGVGDFFDVVRRGFRRSVLFLGGIGFRPLACVVVKGFAMVRVDVRPQVSSLVEINLVELNIVFVQAFVFVIIRWFISCFLLLFWYSIGNCSALCAYLKAFTSLNEAIT